MNMKFNKLLLEKLKGLTNMTFRVALADDGGQNTPPATDPTGTPNDPTQTQQPTTTPSQPTVNFESLIAQARKEEKEKLYPEITKLKAEKETQTKRINELIIEVAEHKEVARLKDEELKKAQSTKVDSEEVKALKLEVERLTGELALKDSELKTIELDSYKTGKIDEAQGQLIVELVSGTTKEEIDASIEVAKQSYASVMDRVQAQTTPQAQAQTTQTMPSANPVLPVTNPTVNPVHQANVDMNNLARTSLFDGNNKEAYKQIRTQLQL